MFLKKLLCIICSVVFITTGGILTVNADDSIGDVIGINNDNSAFSELVCVIGDKTYVPLRLIFPNLNDKENRIGMTISWSVSYPTIHLIYGSTTGGNLENGAAPYDGIRKCIDIVWAGDPYYGTEASLTVMEYTYDESGERIILSYDDSMALEDPIFLKTVEGGGRIFVSIDDINTLAKLMKLDDIYSVKLYK